MGFNHADHHIFTACVPPDRLGEHGVRFSDTGSVSKKQLELAAVLLGRTFLQPLLGSLEHRAYCLEKSFKVSRFQSFKVNHRKRALPPPLIVFP